MASPAFGVRGHDDRRAEGASIDAPKAPSGVGHWEACPLPSRLRGLGERRELPQQGPGQSPGCYRIFCMFYYRPQNASGSKKNTILLQISLLKSGGDSHHRHIRSCAYAILLIYGRNILQEILNTGNNISFHMFVLYRVKSSDNFYGIP